MTFDSAAGWRQGHLGQLALTNLPLFSIIITCYNKQEYISEAIESAINQKFDSFEIVVIDDWSTDDSWSIICGYAEKNQRICVARHLHGRNLGASASRQLGVELSRGHYLLHLDGDDRLLEGRLSHDADVINKQPGCTSVISRTRYFHQDPQSGTRELCAQDEMIDLIVPVSDHLYSSYELFLLCVYDLQEGKSSLRGLPCIGAVTTRRDIARSIPWLRGVSCAEDIVYYAQLLMHPGIYYSRHCLTDYRLTTQGAWFRSSEDKTEVFWQQFAKRKIELLALDVDRQILLDAQARLQGIISPPPLIQGDPG